MNNKLKMTKAQKDQLYNSHVGVGVLHIKSAHNTLMSIEFCVTPKGKLVHVANGEPIFPFNVWDDSDEDNIQEVLVTP
jgi:hypothetical protein